MKAGGNINVPGMFKETPLHDAARNGHYKVAFIYNMVPLIVGLNLEWVSS